MHHIAITETTVAYWPKRRPPGSGAGTERRGDGVRPGSHPPEAATDGWTPDEQTAIDGLGQTGLDAGLARAAGGTDGVAAERTTVHVG